MNLRREMDLQREREREALFWFGLVYRDLKRGNAGWDLYNYYISVFFFFWGKYYINVFEQAKPVTSVLGPCYGTVCYSVL
jgi:hypothetical protein